MKTIAALLTLFALTLRAEAQQILVPPYLQPGDAPALNREQKVLIWQTDSIPGSFKVEYGPAGKLDQAAKVTSVQLKLNAKTTYLYRATLSKLQFDTQYAYRVTLTGKAVSEATFTSRTKKPQTRFAVFGDCGAGTPQQAGISYQVFQQKPDFVLVTGDNVYVSGLESEYQKNFFPYYLSAETSPEKGSAIMKSIPFYMLVGNHDVRAPDLDKYPDGLAYFYYNDLPMNAPVPTASVQAAGQPETVKAFLKNTGGRFPRLTNYSFDYGNVHIACLDANVYVNPLDPALMQWLVTDMQASKADWKMVAYHHPGFNSSKAHYDYQYMRLLAPILEELGVDMVLTGHVHNYQRTLPLKFEPKKDASGERYLISPEGRVDGKFTLDNDFDGKSNTKPRGIIYIVSGAGGAPLYDTQLSGKPDLWTHDPQENWVPFTARIVSDMHSFTFIETSGKKLRLQQMDVSGKVFDEIEITK
jgi:hypothetical protein